MNNYSREEAEQILVRAVQSSDEVVTRDSLRQMAVEAGISDADLEQAILAHERDREETRILTAFKERRVGKFWSEFWSYFGTCSVCVLIWMFTGRHYFWPGWVMLFWGCGIAEVAAAAFFPDSRTYKRALDKFKGQQKARPLNESTEFLDASRLANPSSTAQNESTGDLPTLRVGVSLHRSKSKKLDD